MELQKDIPKYIRLIIAALTITSLGIAVFISVRVAVDQWIHGYFIATSCVLTGIACLCLACFKKCCVKDAIALTLFLLSITYIFYLVVNKQVAIYFYFAIEFLVISIWLGMIGRLQQDGARVLIILLIITFLILSSGIGVIGRMFPSYTQFAWSELLAIPLSWSIGLWIIALECFFLSFSFYIKELLKLEYGLPILIFSFLFFLNIIIVLGMRADKQSTLYRLVLNEGINIEARFELLIHTHQDESDQLIEILKDQTLASEEVKTLRIMQFLTIHPMFLGIDRADQHLENNVFYSMQTYQRHQYAFEQVKTRLKTFHKESFFIYNPDPEAHHHLILALFYPIIVQGKVVQTYVCYLDCKEFLMQLVQASVQSRLVIELYLDGQKLFSWLEDEAAKEFSQWAVVHSFAFGDAALKFKLLPTQDFYNEQVHFILTWLFFIEGTWAALIMAVLAGFVRRGIMQNQILHKTSMNLRENNELLQLAITSAPVGIWDWKIPEHKVIFDPQMSQFFGLDRQETIMTFDEVMNRIYPEDLPEVKRNINAGLQNQTTIFDVHHRVQYEDGSIHYVAARGKFYYDPQGHPLHMTGVGRDITTEVFTQQMLQMEREKFKTFVETTEDWFWERDNQGTITYSNPSVFKILGYSPQEVIGKPFIQFVAKEDQERVRAYFQEHTSRCLGWSRQQVRWLHKDHGIKWIESTAEPILDVSGRFIGFRGMGRDVTQSQYLEELKNRFISSVSHELRTPLTSILGALSLLIKETTLSEKIKNLVDIANRNTKRLLLLVNDLLEIQRIGEKKIQLQLSKVDVPHILNEVLADYQPILRDKHIDLQCKGCDHPIFIYVDPDRLKQVLLNLLDNAVKFSSSGSAIQVEVVEEVSNIKIQVIDQGRGVAEEFVSKLFQPFSQEDMSKVLPGFGLGLSICKELIEKLGGTIGFAPNPQGGSIFYVILPKYQEKS